MISQSLSHLSHLGCWCWPSCGANRTPKSRGSACFVPRVNHANSCGWRFSSLAATKSPVWEVFSGKMIYKWYSIYIYTYIYTYMHIYIYTFFEKKNIYIYIHIICLIFHCHVWFPGTKTWWNWAIRRYSCLSPHHESPLYRPQPFPSRFFFKRWMLNTSSAPLNAPNQEQQMKSDQEQQMKSGDKKRWNLNLCFLKSLYHFHVPNLSHCFNFHKGCSILFLKFSDFWVLICSHDFSRYLLWLKNLFLPHNSPMMYC